MTRHIDLNTITLAKGSHPEEQDCGDPQRCLFEWYNWLARDAHTHTCPPGVSPILHAFGMRLNDALPDDRRQDLKRYLPNGTSPLAGTAGDGLDETRSYMALDWLIRTYTPAFLDLAGLSEEATALRGLRRVVDLAAAQSADPVVRQASVKAAAAWGVAWAAAGDAAWAAAGAAAGDAAGAAAGDAAGDAAWAVARAVARAAAGTGAGTAARDAAGDALAPTVTQLQDSAIALYDQMIAPAEVTP
jgi:hypothetical protein